MKKLPWTNGALWCTLGIYGDLQYIRLDIHRCLAVAILEHRKRNIERAPDFFNRIMDPTTRTQNLDAQGDSNALDIVRIRCN